MITVQKGPEPGTSNTRTEKTRHAFDLYLYLHGLCGKTKEEKQGEESVSKSRSLRDMVPRVIYSFSVPVYLSTQQKLYGSWSQMSKE